jgi:hypothetical protein
LTAPARRCFNAHKRKFATGRAEEVADRVAFIPLPIAKSTKDCAAGDSECNRIGNQKSAMKTVKMIAALLIGLFLSVPHATLAQEPNEAATLTQQVIQLYKQGQYSISSARLSDP